MLKKMAVYSLIVIALLAHISSIQAEAWEPPEDGYDWIKLVSDEWLKGELIAMYDDVLEFDSKELDLQSFDWGDVAFVRTSKLQSLRLTTDEILYGRLIITKERITVVEGGRIIPRGQLISIAAGGESERNYWDGKIRLGIDKRSGNTDQEDVTFGFKANRRTSVTRLKLDYLGTKSEVNGEKTKDSHRFTADLDWYFSRRVFFRPMSFEYFRDTFQNIAYRVTYSAQVGYYLTDNSKTTWDISAGPGYQETGFDEVQAGEDDAESTSVLELGSLFEHEVSKDIDVEIHYTVKAVNEASGKYNHHFEALLEIELTGELDFEVSYIWDRVEEPTPDELGVFPDKNDERLVVGLSYEF